MQLDRTAIGNYECPDDPGEECYGRSEKRRSVCDDEADILAASAMSSVVIEIGTGLGVSTRAMADAADIVVTVDTDSWVAETVAPGLPPNVLALRAVPDVHGRPFDMAFIDGCHTFAEVAKDIERVAKVLKPGGLVFFHDFAGDVRRAAMSAGMEVQQEYETPAALAVCRFPSAEMEAHREQHGL